MTTQTPIEGAYKEWRKLRHKYHAKRRERDQVWLRRYFWLRGHRHTTRDWRRKHKSMLVDRINTSLTETQQWLDNAERVQAWLTDVDSKLGDNDGPQRRTMRKFIDRVSEYIDEVSDEMPDTVPTSRGESLDLFTEEVSGFFATLGLVEHEEWNERDDGCLWFTDEESGEHYHFSFASLFTGRGMRYDVSSRMVIDPNYASRWRQYPMVDLGHIATLSNPQLRDVTRPMRDYFGAWDNIVPAIRDTGVPLPEGVSIRGID